MTVPNNPAISAVAFGLVLAFVGVGCQDEDKHGCTKDGDCRGARICRDGECVDSEVDSNSGVRRDAGGGDSGAGSACVAARAMVDECFAAAMPESTFDVDWSTCDTARDECAAACATAGECEDIACSFDANIDCVGPDAFFECLERECGRECVVDDDCAAVYDCCGAGWICYPEAFPPDLCEMACPTPSPPAECGCADRFCAAQ